MKIIRVILFCANEERLFTLHLQDIDPVPDRRAGEYGGTTKAFLFFRLYSLWRAPYDYD